MRGVLFLLFGTFLLSSSVSAVKVGPCFVKMENRTFAFMEGTVGPLYNTETVEECQNICVQMTKCMAYTYEFKSKKCSIYHFYPDIGNLEKEIPCKEPCVTYYISLPTFCYNISTDYIFYRAYLTRLDDCNTFASLCKSVHILEAEANSSKDVFEKMKIEHKEKLNEHGRTLIDMQDENDALKSQLNEHGEKNDALQSQLNEHDRTLIDMRDKNDALQTKLDELEKKVVVMESLEFMRKAFCTLHKMDYDTRTGICYKYIAEKLTWYDARERCQQLGGDLLSIHSQQENDFAHSISKGKRYELWIGLNDQQNESIFTWSDGSTVNYKQWSSGQPKDGQGANCVYIGRDTGNWYNYSCADKSHSICRI